MKNPLAAKGLITNVTQERIHTNEKQFSQDARMAFTNMLGIGLLSRTNNMLFLKRALQ